MLAILCFPCGDLLKLGIDLGQLDFVRAQLGDPAFVVDRDLFAEDRPRVGVVLLDGRTGEADERGVRQGVAHVAIQPVNQIVLAAVGFVGDYDEKRARDATRV